MNNSAAATAFNNASTRQSFHPNQYSGTWTRSDQQPLRPSFLPTRDDYSRPPPSSAWNSSTSSWQQQPPFPPSSYCPSATWGSPSASNGPNWGSSQNPSCQLCCFVLINSLQSPEGLPSGALSSVEECLLKLVACAYSFHCHEKVVLWCCCAGLKSNPPPPPGRNSFFYC